MHLIVGQLRQPRLVFVLRFAAMADLGFQPGHLGVGVEQSLCAYARRRWRQNGFRALLKPGFGFAQRGVLRFKVDDRALDFARQAFALGLRLVAPQQPEQLLLARQLDRCIRGTAGRLPPALPGAPSAPPSSRRMSSTRVRFSRVSAMRFSVSLRRSLYLVTPAASSRKTRNSSGLASMMREIVPWPMMA
jgi:hypothetical protein